MTANIELPVILTTHTEPGQTATRDCYGAPTEPDSEPRVTIERAELDHPAICAQVPGWTKKSPAKDQWYWVKFPDREPEIMRLSIGILRMLRDDLEWAPILAPGSPVPVTLNREHCGQQWADWETQLESEKPEADLL